MEPLFLLTFIVVASNSPPVQRRWQRWRDLQRVYRPQQRELVNLIHSDRKFAKVYTKFYTASRKNDDYAALQSLLECLELQPAVPELHYNVGQWLNRLGRTEQARAALARCLELDPDFGAALGLAALLDSEFNPEAASGEARRARVLDPHNLHAAVVLCAAAARQQQYAEVLQICQDWLTPAGKLRLDGERKLRSPWNRRDIIAPFRLWRAAALSSGGRWMQSLADIQFVLEGGGELSPGAKRLLFSYYLATQDYDHARAVMEEWAQEASLDWLPAFSAGEWNYAQGRWAEAQEALSTSLERAKSPTERTASQALLGWTAWKLGNLQTARTLAESLSQRSGWLLLAQLQLVAGEVPEAEQVIGNCLAEKAEDITAWHLQGQIFEAQGRLPEALQSYSRCVELGRKGFSHWRPEEDRVEKAQLRITELRRRGRAKSSA